MRPFYLLILLVCILALVACGSEDELIPPGFSNITGSGSLGSTEVLTKPSQDPDVTISWNIDDFAATIVANSIVTGETSVPVDGNDGSWTFTFSPAEEENVVSFTASDRRGNINQLFLTVLHDTTPPVVVLNGVTQSVDPTNPAIPQLIVAFNEPLLDISVITAIFAVDGNQVLGVTFDPLNPTIVMLTLSAPLATGPYQLTCSGITDLATPDGNTVQDDYSFPFTIAPIVE